MDAQLEKIKAPKENSCGFRQIFFSFFYKNVSFKSKGCKPLFYFNPRCVVIEPTLIKYGTDSHHLRWRNQQAPVKDVMSWFDLPPSKIKNPLFQNLLWIWTGCTTCFVQREKEKAWQAVTATASGLGHFFLKLSIISSSHHLETLHWKLQPCLMWGKNLVNRLTWRAVSKHGAAVSLRRAWCNQEKCDTCLV